MAEIKTEKVKSEKSESDYVLMKNFGATIDGSHKFWPKGSAFTIEKDGELISLLHRLGAPIELKG